MRRTKIVATIGPASRDEETLARLVEAGLDVARLNFAHGTFEQAAENVDRIRAAANRAGRQVAVLQDLPGPKLRIGPVRDDLAELAPGDTLTLVCGSDEEGDHTCLSVSWAGLCEAVEPEDVVYLADGAVRLRVKAIRGQDVETRVEVGGGVTSRQGLNVPGELAALPAVAEDDLERLRFGESIGVDLVALSFVRRPDEITDLREHTGTPIVAKIEKPQAVENLDAIAHVSDCLMVARGDLGIEMEIERVPLVQKHIIRKAGELARPVITATQMLDSMVVSSRPTRAEVADVANAIMDGTDAVMLSQETAVGAHPVEAVRMMDAIARTTESELPLDTGTITASCGPIGPSRTPPTPWPTTRVTRPCSWTWRRWWCPRCRGGRRGSSPPIAPACPSTCSRPTRRWCAAPRSCGVSPPRRWSPTA